MGEHGPLLQPDGTWLYAYLGYSPAPVGYCLGFQATCTLLSTASDDPVFKQAIANELLAIEAFEDHYHTQGHSTWYEAVSCYNRYLVDLRAKLQEGPTSKCCVCGSICKLFWSFRGNSMRRPVCDRHTSKSILLTQLEDRS